MCTLRCRREHCKSASAILLASACEGYASFISWWEEEMVAKQFLEEAMMEATMAPREYLTMSSELNSSGDKARA
jgi:hypothetical protein